MIRIHQLALLMMVLGVLAGCTPSPSTAISIPLQPPPIGECFRSVTVEVYADLNGNGIRDSDEPPVEGINVGIIRKGDPPKLINGADTSADGKAEVGFISTDEDCGKDYLIGVLSMPSEYAPPAKPLKPFGEVWDSGKDVQIGLLLDDPEPTRTPVGG